jgi:myo-inositol 2-dehydrogenase / D-chiro-inositol 1-dehydrogenase
MSRKDETTRRDFIKTTSAATVATAIGGLVVPGAYAAGSDTLKVGVVGCGGRGTGAAEQILRAGPGVKLVALGDVFKDRLEEARKELATKGEHGKVSDANCFVGFDAYKNVIASGVDVVILATPPGFRPLHIKAAVDAGKHIFTEKPVAVDGTGIRSVLESYEKSKQKNLSIVAGTQRRHQTGYLRTMEMIKQGAIGQIVAARCYWNQGSLWFKKKEPNWSDMEWQIRNWVYFTWLSGDHLVEQHVHNIDIINWAMDAHPVSAVGMGGRQARTAPEFGHIYDHFAVDYKYQNGVHLMSMCRQIDGCEKNVSEEVVGTEGNCNFARYSITGKRPWRFRDTDNEPYLQEHIDLVNSIRSGKTVNELKNIAESTLTAIMGRMSAYTGKEVTWEQALNSKEDFMPKTLAWGTLPVPPVAIPGETQLI